MFARGVFPRAFVVRDVPFIEQMTRLPVTIYESL
jgi:hypothetical protein